MKKLLFLLLIIILLVVGGLAYTGFIPALSPIFAKQKDLGVKPDPQQYIQVNEELGRSVNLSESEYPYDGLPEFSGTVNIDNSYTDQQITSVLDVWSTQWSATPFYNVQVRLNDDGTAEASGILKVEKAISLAKELGYSDEQINKAADLVSYINGDLPVYLKGTSQVTNNDVTSSVTQMRIGNINVPDDIKNMVVAATENAIERRIQQIPELSVESMDHKSGELKIVGTIPEKETAR